MPLPTSASVQDKFIPELAKAFFSMDESRLSVMCRDAAMAQIRAVAAAREVEGLSMGSSVLAVQKTDLVHARKLEAGVPIILVTSLVQYIHCVRNRKVREPVQKMHRYPTRGSFAAATALSSRGTRFFPVILWHCRARLLRAPNLTSERRISSLQ